MDYGCFLMRTNNAPKAEECSREAVALNAGDFDAVQLHGLVLGSRGNLEGAEPFLKSALEMKTSSISSWLLVAILYELMGRGTHRDASRT